MHPATYRRFPAEWEPQDCVLIAWPNPTGDFAPWLTEVEHCYSRIAAEISKRQTLLIACAGSAHRTVISRRLDEYAADRVAEQIRLIDVVFDDCWVRDTAPLTVSVGGRLRLTQFQFNGWGGKHPYANDARIGRALWEAGAFGALPLDAVPIVLEGGSVESDGNGSILTTAQCLLNRNRNPQLSRPEIEATLRQWLGCERILWLTRGGIEGDDTDAHIDTLARFCAPDTIAYSACDDACDDHYHELQAMADELSGLRTGEQQPYRLVPLPVPSAIYAADGARLPATYTNFLIINDAVLLPIYCDPCDQIAIARLTACFPSHTVVPIDCRALIRQYGSLHCMTMQFPRQP